MRMIERRGDPALPYHPWQQEWEASPNDYSQLHEVLQALRRRWRLIAGFTLGAVMLMGIGCLLAERRFTATAVLHVDNQPPQVTNLPQVVATPSYLESVEFFQDQVKFLQSRTLAARVIGDLDLEHDRRFLPVANEDGPINATIAAAGRLLSDVAAWLRERMRPSAPPASEGDGSGEAVDPAFGHVGRYLRALEVKPVTNSRLIEVSFTSPSPDLARRIANAHVEAYIRRNLQAKFELTGEARKFLDSEIDRVQGELTTAEQALNDFRRSHHVVSLDDKENAIVERLGDLSRRLTQAEADRIAAEADYRLVKSREEDALPSVIGNALIQGLKQDVSRLEVRQAELMQTFLPSSPQVQEIAGQLKQARSRLNQETQRVVGGVESLYLSALGREQSLRSELDEQQETVLNLKEISGQYIRLDQTVNTTRALYATLLQRMKETDVVKGVQLSNATIMDPAEVPTAPSSPAVLFDLGFALIFGLGLGTALAFVLENLDRSMKTPDDVRQMLDLPTLGVVPDFGRLGAVRRTHAALIAPNGNGNGKGTGKALPPPRDALTLMPPGSPATEAYRSIRTSVLFFNPERPPRSLLVTSSQPQEGKTSTTVNLAISLSLLGRRVVVVDADLRQARCHRALGLQPGAGLAEVLRGTAGFDDVVTRVCLPTGRAEADELGGPNLDLLQAGRLPGDPAELLGSPRMVGLLRDLLARYDSVLIDSPPIFPITDSAILAPHVDGVVLVVRGHRTDRHITREALERLRFMQAKVMGVVLNGVDPGSQYYQSYAHYFAA